MAKILGIDLGTTNSVVAIIEAGVPRVLENREGGHLTPSVVAVSKSAERLAGVVAKRQAVTNPKNTIYSIKRVIGRRFKDAEVQNAIKVLPYEVRESANGGIEVKMGDPAAGSGQGPWYRAEEVSAMILQKLKADAEAKLGETITEAVITVPAYFDDAQRAATKAAGEVAGLTVKRILPEPTAAALAYGLDKKANAKILVYDFGGGTFDVSILEIGDNLIEAKGIGGDSFLGGDDFDEVIMNHLADAFQREQGIDLRKDALAIQRLKDAAEKAKQELSSVFETEINLPFITSNADGPKHLHLTLKRTTLEELTRPLVERSIEIVKKTMAEIGNPTIDEIIMVGGQTRMPLIQARVKEYFGKEPKKDINPDEVVAIGAAIQAGILQGDVREILLLDVIPLTFSIETLGGIAHPMIPKNTPIPFSKNETFTTAADNQPSVEVHVTQGERKMSVDNKTVARFILDGLAPGSRGTPQIDVSFDLDVNGLLTILAKDKTTGKTQTVKVEGSANLQSEEIERMKREAEQHAAEDQQKQKIAEAHNQAEHALYQGRKFLQEHGDKISPEQKASLEEKVQSLEGLKSSTDLEAMTRAMTELTQALSQISGTMQSQSSAGSTSTDEPVNPAADEGMAPPPTA